MRLMLVSKNANFDEIKEKVLRHSSGDIVLKYYDHGSEGLVVVSPYCVYQFIREDIGSEKNVIINVYASRKMMFDALKQLHEVYEINIYDFTVEAIREVGI